MSKHDEQVVVQEDVEIARARAVRQAISARFGHDPYRLVAHYIERQKEHEERLLRAPEPAMDSSGTT